MPRQDIGDIFDWTQLVKLRQLNGRVSNWTLWDLLMSNAMRLPGHEALVDTFLGVDQRRRKTWEDLLAEVNLVILNLMARGVTKGDIVVLQLPNIIENCVLRYAASKLGFMVHGAQIDLGEAEVKSMLELLDPVATIVIPEHHGRPIWQWHQEYRETHPNLKQIFVVTKPGDPIPTGVHPFTELLDEQVLDLFSFTDIERLCMDPADIFQLIPTGGTTGAPKIAMHSHLTFPHMHALTLVENNQMTDLDICLMFGPINGATGTAHGTETFIIAGAKMVYLTEFDEQDALQLTEEEGVTIWVGGPALMIRCATHPAFERVGLATLNRVSFLGAPLPLEVGKKFFAKGIRVASTYGSTTFGAAASGRPFMQSEEELLHTTGPAPWGIELFLLDANGNRVPPGEYGEVVGWSPHHGYFERAGSYSYNNDIYPRRSEEGYGGYEYTGDVGVLDAKGNLTVVGRSKDMILRGGQNIFPKEIEDILEQHPKVAQVAIVGMPDLLLGEKACAYVILKAGVDNLTLEELTSMLESRGITKYKWPERLEIIDEMPTSPGGKISKKLLREDIEAKLKQEGLV